MAGQGSGQSFIDKLRDVAEQVSAREGCFLYDLEFVGVGASRALRVYIDKEEAGGASIEDCSHVSRGLNEVLDADDFIPGGNYNLEVSTPGLERVLKETRHYEKALGKMVSVKSFAPLTQFNPELPELGLAKQATGKLLSHDKQGLKVELPLKVAGEMTAREVFVPFESVTKAHIVFEFDDKSLSPKGKPAKGPKHKSQADNKP
jgi:ribosome maturation factor RimP